MMMLALPHFFFKSFNAFAQARFCFGKTRSKTKVFCCPYTASMPHTRIRNLFYSKA